jgi:SpoVK/Ycf46/Vps4 family AAA+-type ATPase
MAMLQNWPQSTSMTEKPNVKWEDIAGLEGAKEEVLKDFESPLSEEDLQKGNEWADEVGSERLSSWANGLTYKSQLDHYNSV